MTPRDWPPTGASVTVDILLPDTTLTNLTTRVLATTVTGLNLLPPIIDRPVGADISGQPVALKWHDPDSGPSTITGRLGTVARGDRGSPWKVAITGTVTRDQRRHYIREHVAGKATLTQPTTGAVPQARSRTGPTGPVLIGDIADLSEGGVRVRTPTPPHLDMGSPLQVRLDPVDGDPATVPDCRILRMESVADAWVVVARFPDRYPDDNIVRALVFTAMRHRIRAVHAMTDTDTEETGHA